MVFSPLKFPLCGWTRSRCHCVEELLSAGLSRTPQPFCWWCSVARAMLCCGVVSVAVVANFDVGISNLDIEQRFLVGQSLDDIGQRCGVVDVP